MQLFKNVTAGILTFCFITIKQLVSKIKQGTRVRLVNGASRNKQSAVATQCHRNGNTMAESQLYRIVGGSGLDHYKDPRGKQINNTATLNLSAQELHKVSGGSGGHHNDDPRGVDKNGELIRSKTAPALTQHTLNATQLVKIVGGSTGAQVKDPRAEGENVEMYNSYRTTPTALTTQV
ncbi:hypothetical protein [Pseudoalteromonas sp. NC201]|uniref:hypothetical protein n=1 Tax=Pseudoalteromonas sp. NC201 TaxID=1514074 RepID=UPI000C7AC6D3|nr:hypothetical protein [Pseudoalteromonas sp. NC201]AUJ72639.1 hypothetical protein PNC201_22115 [Pseudoalteromonas sp. NC201]